MFKRGWFRRNWIYSDEGFSVQVVGRSEVAYRERNRRMAITAEMLARGFAIHLETIGRWDDDALHSVHPGERDRIAANIKRALESQGQTVDLV